MQETGFCANGTVAVFYLDMLRRFNRKGHGLAMAASCITHVHASCDSRCDGQAIIPRVFAKDEDLYVRQLKIS